MRGVVTVLLVVPAVAGCFGDGKAEPSLEGFYAVYEVEGQPSYSLLLDGPYERYDADLTKRLAFRLRETQLEHPRPWHAREAEYYDGAATKVRNDKCGVMTGGPEGQCEAFGISWRNQFSDPFTVNTKGLFWPLVESPWLDRSWRGDTLRIQHLADSNVVGGDCYEYEGHKPIPVRSCSGHLRLVEYDGWDLASIPAWPTEPTRAAGGLHANELFPDAELDLMGEGFTPLQALEALRATSSEAGTELAAGCVIATSLTPGSPFTRAPQDALLEGDVTPLVEVRFTVQDDDGPAIDYTVHWVRDDDGQRRFSTTVTRDVADPPGITCAFKRAQGWPNIGAREFLAFSQRLGNPLDGGFRAAWTPRVWIDLPGLHYEVHPWGGAMVLLDGGLGQIAHLSNNGGTLDPEQGG